jgi:hypothetical protein
MRNQFVHMTEITLFKWLGRQCEIKFHQRTDDTGIDPA